MALPGFNKVELKVLILEEWEAVCYIGGNSSAHFRDAFTMPTANRNGVVRAANQHCGNRMNNFYCKYCARLTPGSAMTRVQVQGCGWYEG